jgi:hypothetical protein
MAHIHELEGINQKYFSQGHTQGYKKSACGTFPACTFLHSTASEAGKMVKINPYCYNQVGFTTIKQQQTHANYSQTTAVM